MGATKGKQRGNKTRNLFPIICLRNELQSQAVNVISTFRGLHGTTALRTGDC